MKVLVCGSRNWTGTNAVHIMREELGKLDPGTMIVEGGAKGADEMARNMSLNFYEFNIVTVWPNWNAYGKSAGPRRNRVMLDMKPDLVIAFHEDLEKSKGTADTVREARRRGIPVVVRS